jgi:hypothetical protein
MLENLVVDLFSNIVPTQTYLSYNFWRTSSDLNKHLDRLR